MSKFNIVDGPKSSDELFRALRASMDGHTVVFLCENGKKLHAMLTTLGVPIPRHDAPWRLSGQAHWDHVENWELHGEFSPSTPITARRVIYEFSATYRPDEHCGAVNVGEHVGNI